MKVWKYVVPITSDPIVLSMPYDSGLLSLQLQHDVPCLWAIVDPDNAPADRVFHWAPTGGDAPPGGVYVGTVQDGRLVFHLFESRNGGRARSDA